MDTGRRRRTGSLQREKNGVWIARVSVCGRTFSRTSATTDHGEARRFLAAFVAAMEDAHREASGSCPLLKEWPLYERSPDAARLTPSGRMSRYRVWLRFAEWMKSAHPEVSDAAGVTHRIADEYIGFYGDGRAATTQNLCIGALRDVFRVLCAAHGVAENPWRLLPARFGDSRVRRALSGEEVRRLIAAAGVAGGEWPRLFALAVYTGMRLGDCCRLTWENVDLAQGIIQIVPHKTRRHSGGRPVTIPVHERLMATLADTPPSARRSYVLPVIAADYAMRRWRISKGLDRIFDGAGIVRSVVCEGRRRRTPSATFHSLRHSFVSFAANAGVPLAIVQSIVGHASSAMTRHYYHANEAALRQAVNAIPSFGADGQVVRNGANCIGAAAGFGGASGSRPLTLGQRLERADRLFRRGLVSADEHAGLRKRILSEA